MGTFYTVDRSGQLSAGMELLLRKHADVDPPELQKHVDFMFPDGVSQHGDAYFLKNDSNAAVASPAIEILFEFVRRAHFHTKPSRFSSSFGVETLAEAHAFNVRFCQGRSAVWQVEADSYFKCNMELLTRNQTVLVHSYLAHLYWEGAAGPFPPFWEFLLVPPVRVIRQIVEENHDASS